MSDRAVRLGVRPRIRAVLFDRDGTLVQDVPYNGDPERVRLRLGAARCVQRLRAAGLLLGLVTNQSGVARGLLTRGQVDLVNARLTDLVGPFDTIRVCPHVAWQGCACRKPRPGLIYAAAHDLGVPTREVVVIGDIAADVLAGYAAGARAVLVPNSATLDGEVLAAPIRCDDLDAAVDLVLAWARGSETGTTGTGTTPVAPGGRP